jgi:hypothetical protein
LGKGVRPNLSVIIAGFREGDGGLFSSLAFWRVLQNRKNLHRKDAKDAKKRKKKEEKTILLQKNSILSFAFVFLCVLRIFAVQISLILPKSTN